MYDVASQDEQALRTQLGQARERLDGLVRDLRAVDGDLEDLSGERQQFGLVSQACDALEQLSDQGASGLFWGESSINGDGDQHLRLVRGRLDGFEKRILETEGRRQAILEKIECEQEAADFIADDLLDIQRREEERKQEWLVEREPGTLALRDSRMPWSRGGEDDQRFRKSLAASLLLALLLGLMLPLIDLPLPEPWETAEVAERLTQLIREERPLPPPPPQAQTRPEPTETKTEESSDEPNPVPPVSPKPDAESKGILAFREKFSGLAEDVAASKLGANARITSSGEVGASRTQRSLVSTQAPTSSGGINLAALSRDVGGGGGEGIQGVQVARATSSIGGGGGQSDRPLSDGPGPGRTDEEIQIVFDRHKAALYRLYNRELRRDPTLQGQMALRLTIEPDGSVSLCELKSTDMNAPKLGEQVVARVKTFDFGAKEGVPPITILYPIDFLPAR